MKYTLEHIYLNVGREDKIAGITFKRDSESAKLYGNFITVEFIYTQKERHEFDELILKDNYSLSGYSRAKYLGDDLSKELITRLATEGINSKDIIEILYPIGSNDNTFHSKEKRKITTLNIKTTQLPKGQDYDWMYGFKKRLVSESIGLSPYERNWYLAAKYYYEPDNLTESEVKEIFIEGLQLKEEIEWEYLSIKYQREEITDEEKKRLAQLLNNKYLASRLLLDKYLIQAGSSLKKLVSENIEKAVDLYEKIMFFKDRRLNVNGQKPIFIDINSYLHIYMRHVEEFKVNKQFEHKDNFQWKEEDVFTVIQHVIHEANNEIQDFFKANPEKRFSKHGDQSLYFEGDYYTFHIENDGRISTFHKNRK